MIYVFNPEHDYALANNGPHFVPPESAIRFARDCAPFLLYLMDDDDLLYQPYDAERPFLTFCQRRGLNSYPTSLSRTRLACWAFARFISMHLGFLMAS